MFMKSYRQAYGRVTICSECGFLAVSSAQLIDLGNGMFV
jgi:hypothetical protein